MAEKIYIIFQNKKLIESLCTELNDRNLAYVLWKINKDSRINFKKSPPQGIFYNAVNPNSQARGNKSVNEITKSLLNWLNMHNCKVINSLEALELEPRKTKITHVENEEEFIENFNKIQDDPSHESYQKIKIFFFTAGWCGNCHVLKPPLQKLQDENIEVYYFNVDNCPEMCEQFKISAIPFVAFIRGNNILETHLGGNLPKFTSILKKYISETSTIRSSMLPTVNEVNEDDESISSSDSNDNDISR